MLLGLLRGGYSATEIVYYLVVVLISMTMAFSFHEFMHALVATWCGDNTARNLGRLTINPISHIDPIGTLCILLVGFGWGKPVPYNPNNLTRFKSKKLMRQMVHLAGVFGNFLLALLFGIIMAFTVVFGDRNASTVKAILDVCYYTIEYNLMLMAFNLLPIPPLDGFRVLDEFLPIKAKYSNGYRAFITKGPQILWIVILICNFMNIRLFSFLINIIEFPARIIISLVQSGILNLFT